MTVLDLAQVPMSASYPTDNPKPVPLSPLPARMVAEPIPASPAGDFDILRVFAESYEDVQRTRIGIRHRIDTKAIPVDPVADALASLDESEKKLKLAMRRAFRRAAPEVRAWVLQTPGVGEHLMARLLGVIGHPVIATPYHWEGEGDNRRLIADQPYLRSVSQLWSYCGHGDPTRRRRKGMAADEATALGNPRAKMLVHLIAEGTMKCVGGQSRGESHSAVAPDAPEVTDGGATSRPQPNDLAPRRRSPYRDVYELARARYEGEDKWANDLHRHNSALRVTGKAILKDLWIAANEALAGERSTA
jgi:hypothetical protein